MGWWNEKLNIFEIHQYFKGIYLSEKKLKALSLGVLANLGSVTMW